MKTSRNAIVGPAKVFKIDDQRFEITCNALKNLPIEKGDRVLFRTSNSDTETEHITASPKQVYLGTDAVKYLVEKQVSCVGMDYLLINDNNSPEISKLFSGNSISIIQGLKLGNIEPGDYEMICLPVSATDTATSQSRVILRPGKKALPEFA